MAKSILQLHKEDEEDRERRYYFCWCFKKEYLCFEPTKFGWEHDKCWHHQNFCVNTNPT